MMNEGEIIVYHPDSTLRLEVKVDGTMVWLNRLQMAELIVQSAGGGGLACPSWATMRNPVLSCRFTQGESEK